jgi:hypothetical protein
MRKADCLNCKYRTVGPVQGSNLFTVSHMEHTNALFRRTVEFLRVTAGSSFVMSPSTKALWRRQLASTGTSHSSCCARFTDKRNAL